MILAEAILTTLEYFDVQDRPLTLLEIHTYLLNPTGFPVRFLEPMLVSDILRILENELSSNIVLFEGFYALAGREEIIHNRRSNNFYSIPRMRRVRKYLPLSRYIPFLQAAALSGSEALSTSKQGSDIDILLLVKTNRIWTARFFATGLYQLLGIRRHGRYVENRFCLNHYIAGTKLIQNDTNIYTAIEYASLIPYYGGDVLSKFQRANSGWIKSFLPNFEPIKRQSSSKTVLQKSIEFLLTGWFGDTFEALLGRLQRRRIISQSHIIIERDELSFHPGSKGQQVLQRFEQRIKST